MLYYRSMVENKPLSKQQRKVLETGRAHAQQAAAHPDLLELYRNPHVPVYEIVAAVLPELAEQFPNAARIAVANAVREMISPDERRAISRMRTVLSLQERHRSLKLADPEAYTQRQRKAGTNRKLTAEDVDKAIRARGRTPWVDSEKSFVEAACVDANFYYQSGPQKGKINHSVVAAAVNQTFHGGQEVRTGRSIREYLVIMRKKQA